LTNFLLEADHHGQSFYRIYDRNETKLVIVARTYTQWLSGTYHDIVNNKGNKQYPVRGNGEAQKETSLGWHLVNCTGNL
jgi:hypothetical protein